MAKREIAIDLGTSRTTIFLNGTGLVIDEPSIVAVSKNQKNKIVRTSGLKATKLEGQTSDDAIFVSPIQNGIIVDEDSCVVMLKDFLKKLIPSNAVFYPKYKVILCVPIGLSVKEKFIMENVCIKANILDIKLVEGILATAVGIDIPIEQTFGHLVVNIGGGKTEIGVISSAEIIDGCTVSIGGFSIDEAIASYIQSRYNMIISKSQACKIKNEIGCLYTNNTSEMLINGKDINFGEPISSTIKASEIAMCIQPLIMDIVGHIDKVIKNCSTEIIDNIFTKGLYLCGGISKLEGISKMISQLLGLKVWFVQNPEFAQIIGAGKLINNPELLCEILSK